LRAAALDLLGRQPLPSRRRALHVTTHLRVMSYNVHGCFGVDGRISPRRIARVIAQQSPDLVALQEIDEGRVRSRSERQSAMIAELLGYHVIFCPTVIRGEEHYGHAILSRLPIETVKIAQLPQHPGGLWPEARGALLSRIRFGDLPVNIVTTHLGLSSRERLAQVEALLGPDWLGPVLETEPVIVCGDFNFAPRSLPFRRMTARLRHVVQAGTRRIYTFSSARPFIQLDHIFASRHFHPERVIAVRNDLTRVASDHLPLVADLTWRS
jgi:endonuclease/exonuclease/phosphatase family metal-dependent hydrolase